MLILASVRERWSSLLAAFSAVLVGVALITTALVLHDSSLPKVQPRYSEAAALALPPRAVDEDGSAKDHIPWKPSEVRSLTAELASLDTVRAAVADRSFYAQAFHGRTPVADEGAVEAGHGFASTRLGPYALVEGRAPTADHEVVVDRALETAVGSTLTLNLTAGRTDFTVVGTVNGPGYYFTDAFAARQQPAVRAIGLLAAEGTPTSDLTADAKTALGDAGTVAAGDDRAALQPAHLTHKRFLGTQLLGAMALLALFTTVFVVASMLVLATGLRRREIGLLRSLGASPGQIRRMILGEAAVVGLLGSIAGCLVGTAATPLPRAILADLDITPPDLALRVSLWPLLTATLVGVGVSVLGAWSASRLAARVAPLEALLDGRTSARTTRRTRLLGGLGVLVLGVALTLATATTTADDRVNLALLATMTLIVAAALLAPVCIRPFARVLTAPFARTGTAGPLLIRAELTAHTHRAASLAAPVIATVGFAVLLTGMVETMRVAYPAGDALKLKGQIIVTPDGTPGNTDEVVAAHPVGKAALPTRAFLPGPSEDPTVIDVLGSRDPRWDKPDQAVLGSRTATTLGLETGDRTPVRFADGTTVTLRVAEVLPDDPARGDFVVARTLVRTHDPAALTDDIFVPAAHTPTTLIPGTAHHDALRFALDDYETDAELTDALALMLIVIAVGYSGIAVANSTAMAAHSRRRDLAVLRSAGGTTRQLLLATAGETTLIVTIGTLLGTAVTLPPLLAMASGLSQTTATPVPLNLDLPTLTTATLTTLLLALTTSLTTTHRTLRHTPT